MNITINRSKIEKRKREYISDNDLVTYFGKNFNKHIIKYSELKNYNSIDELLPNNKSFVIILIEFLKNCGHWVMLSKYKIDNKYIIEYFNSYGSFPSHELKLVDDDKLEELDVYKKYLNILLTKAMKKYKIIYNDIQFQSDNPEIATCGRHCILRQIMIKYFDLNLFEYIDFMKNIKKYCNCSYDDIVSYFIK